MRLIQKNRLHLPLRKTVSVTGDGILFATRSLDTKAINSGNPAGYDLFHQ